MATQSVATVRVPAVGHDDTLGHARGARGEQDVGRVVGAEPRRCAASTSAAAAGVARADEVVPHSAARPAGAPGDDHRLEVRQVGPRPSSMAT